MHKRTKNRLLTILVLMVCFSLGAYIILSNLQDNIVFFYPPSEIDKIQLNQSKIRVGGLVKEGSIIQITERKIRFTITDNNSDLDIEYEGALPVLFREKQGIIAEGILSKVSVAENKAIIFLANNLLAKHDENYMPPEIKKNLK